MDNESFKKANVNVLKDRLKNILRGYEPLGGRVSMPSLTNEDENVILIEDFECLVLSFYGVFCVKPIIVFKGQFRVHNRVFRRNLELFH
jgi:hypothetical protein